MPVSKHYVEVELGGKYNPLRNSEFLVRREGDSVGVYLNVTKRKTLENIANGRLPSYAFPAKFDTLGGALNCMERFGSINYKTRERLEKYFLK